MSILLVILCFAVPFAAQAAPSSMVIPYAGAMTYHDATAKEGGTLVGVYGMQTDGVEYLLEAALDHLHITYQDRPALDQWDSTLVYTYYHSPRWRSRLGTHFVSSDDAYTDKAITVFGGRHYTSSSRWTAGVDAYLTRYPNYQPNKLTVLQLSPRAGMTMPAGRGLTVADELLGHLIYMNDDPVGEGSPYLSVENRLSLAWDRWQLLETAWIGEQRFGVQQDGFALFNLADVYHRSISLDLLYTISATGRVGMRLQQARFTEANTQRRATSTAVVLSGYVQY
jgi:hypothetical protein